jgi:flagellar basal-body rod protein FlgB
VIDAAFPAMGRQVRPLRSAIASERTRTVIGRLDQLLGFHSTALGLRAQRQQVLASNLANADTPRYKSRDFDFRGALQQAVAEGTAAGGPRSPSVPSPALVRTSSRHLAGSAPVTPPGGVAAPGSPTLQYRTLVQGSVDNNTVDMDVERNHFADNALRHDASIVMLNSQIRGMLTAIQGQ